jgi:ATP-dependent HslUV protease, peptidase subunit HslV
MIRSTTILALRHRGVTVVAGDGQVSHGDQIMKHGARKVRPLAKGAVLAGFAGSAADGLTLFEKLEQRLDEFDGHLARAAVALARDWRTDRVLRRLEALLIAADREQMFVLSGSGDVIEPDAAVTAIGSGGPIAQAAATALIEHADLGAEAIARAAMAIAARQCVYTNEQVVLETLA